VGAPNQLGMSNRLLALLPLADYERVAPQLQHVELPRGMVLFELGEPIDKVYFLTSGVGSVIVTTSEGHRTEAGLFGWDGYVPTTAATDVELSSYDVNVQIAGDAYALEYNLFREWMETNRNFAKIITRCLEAFSIQVAYTAVSNAVHDVSERLARWLLMCHDRVPGHEIPITHDFLAVMLAVHRPSVTTSLHVLEGNGFIKAERGMVTIRNRAALEEFAHDAYGRPEQEYRRLMKNLF
jgi:CRP-like cAMP-binding protein